MPTTESTQLYDLLDHARAAAAADLKSLSHQIPTKLVTPLLKGAITAWNNKFELLVGIGLSQVPVVGSILQALNGIVQGHTRLQLSAKHMRKWDGRRKSITVPEATEHFEDATTVMTSVSERLYDNYVKLAVATRAFNQAFEAYTVHRQMKTLEPAHLYAVEFSYLRVEHYREKITAITAEMEYLVKEMHAALGVVSGSCAKSYETFETTMTSWIDNLGHWDAAGRPRGSVVTQEPAGNINAPHGSAGNINALHSQAGNINARHIVEPQPLQPNPMHGGNQSPRRSVPPLPFPPGKK
jgi:hypothetical protein